MRVIWWLVQHTNTICVTVNEFFFGCYSEINSMSVHLCSLTDINILQSPQWYVGIFFASQAICCTDSNTDHKIFNE